HRRVVSLREPGQRAERRGQRGELVPPELDDRVGRSPPGTGPGGLERPRSRVADGVGADLARSGVVDDWRPTDHLHEPQLLVVVDGQTRLVRAEWLPGALE